MDDEPWHVQRLRELEAAGDCARGRTVVFRGEWE